VQVRAIDWTTFGIEDPQVRLSPRPPTDGAATIAESQPFAPLTLQPGEQTTIVLAGIAACDPGAAEAHPTSRSLAVTLDPPAGPTTRRVLQLAGSTGQGVTVPCP
jgi:hypothetical protein